MFTHIPIMSQEILENLSLQSGDSVADLTAGGGGHLKLLADRVGPTGFVLALDKDARAHEPDAAGGIAHELKQIQLVKSSFSELGYIQKQHGIPHFKALLCDLGVSSHQLDTAERGFSFKKDGPLDMRLDPSQGQSAYELIQHTPEKDLANLIYQYGEEKRSRRIAKAIKSEKKLPNSTLALANLIARMCPGYHRIHPATRTFQALRIAVNQELYELENLLNQLEQVMAPHGRVAFITFHSLEDRPIKHFFKQRPQSWKMLHKKPIIPSESEIYLNPRARSAKLRIAEKIT